MAHKRHVQMGIRDPGSGTGDRGSGIRIGLWALGFTYASVRAFMRGPNRVINNATTIQHAAMYANTLR